MEDAVGEQKNGGVEIYKKEKDAHIAASSVGVPLLEENVNAERHSGHGNGGIDEAHNESGDKIERK